jgi:hypothetical protein
MGVNDQLGGQVLNLIANDASRIEMAFYFFPYLLIGPIQAISIMIMLFMLVDLTVLSGLVVLLVTIPAQTLLAKFFDRMRFDLFAFKIRILIQIVKK